MRFMVRVGEEFELSEVMVLNPEIIKAETDLNKAKQQAKDTHNRTVITWAVLSLVTVFLIGSALLGIFDGEFSKLQAVYNVAVVPLSAILAYYFGQRGGASIKQ
jgi:hypothetical protein